MSDLFPPVRLLSDLEPFSSPTFIPPTPHNLPVETAAVSSDVPASVINVAESYRYASIIDLTFTTSTTSQQFLDSPIGRRNILGFRNTSNVAGEIIYIGFGRNATTNSWLTLVPGQITLFDTVVPQDDLYALAATGTPVLAYIYSTFPG